MAFNRFMTRTPMQFDFYKQPLEVISQALQVKQQAYDKNAALADQLLSMSINSMDADRASANALTRGYQQTVDQMAEQYNGDYSKMGRELMGLARKIRKDFTSGGEAFAYEYNKSLYDKWLDFSQKASLSGRGPSVQQVNLGNAYILNNYKGAGYNKETGTFSSLQTPNLVEYQEMSTLVDTFAKNVVPNKVASGEWEVNNGKVWYKNKVGIQEVTPDRIQAAVREGLRSHQGWQAYANQMEQFGAPITEEMYNSQVNRAINSFAYRWKESDQDIMVNPFALKAYEKSLETPEPQPMTSYYSPARSKGQPTERQKAEGAVGIPTSFDASDFNTWSFSAAPGGRMGSFTVQRNKDQSFDQYMKRADVVNKYGQFGQNLYASMSKNPEWNNMSEKEKSHAFRDAYGTAAAEFNRVQDNIYTLNDKTRQNLRENFLQSSFPAQAQYTVVDMKDETTISDITARDMTSMTGYSVSDIQEGGVVQGITNPASGLPMGIELGLPDQGDKKERRYRVVMQGYDARAEETGNNLQKLYYPYYGGASKSPQVPLASVGPYLVQTEVQPTFDQNGKLGQPIEKVYFQEYEVDDQGRPVFDHNNQLKVKDKPFEVPYTLQSLVDSEFRAAGLDYQSNKLKDSKF